VDSAVVRERKEKHGVVGVERKRVEKRRERKVPVLGGLKSE